MPDHSRIWIYNSDRPFSADEKTFILENGKKFIGEWTSHGAKMNAQIDVVHDRFVVIALDESSAGASGCGIDKSVAFIRSISEHLKTDLFMRTTVFFMENNEIKSASLNHFWALRKAGNLDESTPVFDNTIQTLHDLRANWLVPFAKSWHQEMFAR